METALRLTLPPLAGCRDAFARDGFVAAPRCAPDDVLAALATEAECVARTSSVPIDRRPEGAGLVYRVVSGERLRAEAPALFSLYQSAELLDWVAAVTGSASVSRSPHIRSAVNLNCLTRAGERYPEHRDAVPYTALLFLSDLDETAGGEFVIQAIDGRRVEIRPALGGFVLMDGARCPHAVAPLRRDVWRLTVPMVFPAVAAERPEGLDDYLYGA